MRVSLKWLREFVDIDLPVPELCDRLDMTGTKVESVIALGDALDGVLVGRVVSKEPHPNADKLTYCTVDVGGEEPLRIVCGATNFQAGDRVPVACVGATLPGGLAIKRAKLRGLESEGMMCSAAELGMGADSSGLLILPPDAPVGASFASYAGLSDTVLELEVTPNRPDCLSMTGVAREIAAVTGSRYREPAFELAETGAPAEDAVSVRIADAALCPRYTARVIRDIAVGPSPAWLAERVAAAGARPINNVVDVTNYVMFELGQPLHAFDLRTLGLEGGTVAIGIRTAAAGETLVTLDGQDRVLAPDTLLITDPSGPVALAGVMGGEATEVSDATTDILLEAACFDPSSISRTSRRLGLISEASLRFERGVDPDLAAHAADRAAALLAEVGGGTVAPGIVDDYPGEGPPRTLELRVERTNALLGTSLLPSEMSEILGSLGCGVSVADETITVVVPKFRPDLEREVDLIEEVVRVWGMERVAATLPAGRGRVGFRTGEQKARARIGELLRAAGLDEHVGYSFADARDMQRLGWTFAPDETPVEIVNPMSEEQGVLRWTLLPSLLRAVSNNQRRGVPDVHLYELGTAFLTSDGRKQPKERQMIAGALAGSWARPAWNEPAQRLEFFDAKGVVGQLVDGVGVSSWKVRAAQLPFLQPGRSAEVVVRGDVVGWLGEVSHEVLDAFDATGPVAAFEIAAGALLKAASGSPERYREIPRFPAVSLDVAFVVDEPVTAEEIEAAIVSAGRPLLESMRLFDVYRDPAEAAEGERRLPAGTKSLAYSLTYRAPDRTLTDDDVRPAHERLIERVSASVGGRVRS